MPGTIIDDRVSRTCVMVDPMDPVVSTRNITSALRMRVRNSNSRVCGPARSRYGSVTKREPVGGRRIASAGPLFAATSMRSATPSLSVSGEQGFVRCTLTSSRSVRPSLSLSRSVALESPSASQSSGRSPHSGTGSEKVG